MKTIYALLCAFVCMTIHRNYKMVHINGGDHWITCKTCDSRKSKYVRDVKNQVQTFFYFNRNWFTFPFMVPVMIVGTAHWFLTGQEGSFEHPPEHRSRNFVSR